MFTRYTYTRAQVIHTYTHTHMGQPTKEEKEDYERKKTSFRSEWKERYAAEVCQVSADLALLGLFGHRKIIIQQFRLLLLSSSVFSLLFQGRLGLRK